MTTLHHLAVPVRDVDVSSQWYERVLGASIERRTDTDAADQAAGRTRQVWLRVGADVVVNLAEGPVVHRSAQQHFYHYALGTAGADLDDWLGHLSRHEVSVLGPFGHGGLPFVSLYFDDPDGYRWELVVNYAGYAQAREAALNHGGLLGNPMASYEWKELTGDRG